MDDLTVHPEARSGDRFAYASAHDDVEAHYAALERLEAPHGCIAGVVYIGEMVIGEMVIGDDGEQQEIFHPVLCRRCGRS